MDYKARLRQAVSDWFSAKSPNGEVPSVRLAGDPMFPEIQPWLLIVKMENANIGGEERYLVVEESRTSNGKVELMKSHHILATQDTKTGDYRFLEDREEIWDPAESAPINPDGYIQATKRTGDTSIRLRPPQNKNEYIELVERFSGLVDLEMKRTEAEKDPGRARAIARRLPQLISLVNTIGYLRGQDGVFLDVRPDDMHGSGRQGDLYKNEDDFERRLISLAREVTDSSEKEFAKKVLQMYFIEARILS